MKAITAYVLGFFYKKDKKIHFEIIFGSSLTTQNEALSVAQLIFQAQYYIFVEKVLKFE